MRIRSLKVQTAVLVVLIASVSLILLINAGLSHRRDSVRSAESLTSRQAESLSDILKQMEWGAESALTALAATREVQSLSVDGCSRVFKNFIDTFPLYQSLQGALPDGTVFAAASPLPGPMSMADRKYFQDALRTKSFSPGEFVIGKVSKRPAMHFAMPVQDGKGNVIAILQLGVSLEWLEQKFARIELPRGAVIVVSDHRGVILYSHGDARFTPGNPESPDVVQRTHGEARAGIFRSNDETGRTYLVAFEQLRRPGASVPHLTLRLAMPQKEMLSPVNQVFFVNILLLVLGAAGILLAALRLAMKKVLTPLESVVKAASGMASGRLDQRVDVGEACLELAELADSFNRMSEALLAREMALNETLGNLDHARRCAVEEGRKLEAILAAIGDGISIQDKEFRVIYQNENHRALIGDHVGELCYEAYERSGTVCDGCPLALSFVDGTVHRAERSTQKGGGALFVEIAASPVRDADGTIVAGIEVVRDVTGRKAMQIGLERANSQLLSLTQKLEHSNAELQQFAYIASHDLQEPLRTVTSFAQLLASRYAGKLDTDAEEFIGFITEGCARMRRLIDDLLLYSRVESRGKELVPVDPGRAVRDALANLHAAVQASDGKVSWHDLPLIMADLQQLTQLFQNLIGNALKFRGEEVPEVEITASVKGADVTFSVRDNGIGIAQDAHERIFEAFQRLHGHGTYEGTGIGLAVCKKIVLRHGGTIWVESTPGRGAVFRFTMKAAGVLTQEEIKEKHDD